MLDHIGFRVGDLDRSVTFYSAALAPLGYVLVSRDDDMAAFGPKGEPVLWLYRTDGSISTTLHIALTSNQRSGVDGFYAAGMKAGGSDNGPPGVRADYSPTYYAAFLLDPDGNNLEAVCTK